MIRFGKGVLIIISIFKNRTEAESDFYFFFLGLIRLRIPLWVFLFFMATVNSFSGAGGRILLFMALVTK